MITTSKELNYYERGFTGIRIRVQKKDDSTIWNKVKMLRIESRNLYLHAYIILIGISLHDASYLVSVGPLF